MSTAREMEEQAKIRYQEVLNITEILSSSDSGSSISKIYSGSYTSSNSISMLPAEPKIFHGRESELADILKHFSQGTPRIAILGAGGMGKTSLAEAVLHHEEIIDKYQGNRFFVPGDSVSNKVELAGLIGAHLGMKPANDLSRAVLHHILEGPPTLLILDNLETVWEPAQSRKEVEEFLSLLTDIGTLALMITMRGAERPSKVKWTRPFLLPLEPLSKEAAHKMFIDIAEDRHSVEEMDQVLRLTDNMPLSINLLAHMVDVEGCTAILLRWQQQQTSVISEGYDRRSNLELSIALSLASPRITSTPHSQELLSLLSILPDGLSDAELKQSQFTIEDILDCKSALLRTALAYSDDHKQLKALVPIREYMRKFLPPTDEMIRPLLKHFQDLLRVYIVDGGKQSAAFCIGRLTSNYTNILNIIQNGLQLRHPDLADSIYCACDLSRFTLISGRGELLFMDEINSLLHSSNDHRLKVYCIAEMFRSQELGSIPHPETLIAQALEHFNYLDDPDLKAAFHIAVAFYYSNHNQGIHIAAEHCQLAISVAKSSRNSKRQSSALLQLSYIQYYVGQYTMGQTYAMKAQQLAKTSGDLYREALGLYYEAICWLDWGNYRHCISLIKRAKNLLGLCGMSDGDMSSGLMHCEADVHRLKSEYVEALSIQNLILKNAVAADDHYRHGLTLANIAEIEMFTGASCYDIQQKINASQLIFEKGGATRINVYSHIQADLNLREGDMTTTLFCECLRLGWGSSRVASYCLERLADVIRWEAHHDPSWSTVLLAHSLKSKERLGIHKALQFIGDVHLMENDEVTAVSLFTVALEAFTQLDVHHSRAECMIRLGDIARKNGDVLKALELWETARPLFERSSQTKGVQDIDQRIGGISDEVKERHQRNLARLVELNAPTGEAEEGDEDSSDAGEPELEEPQMKLITA
ncbi:hypothetical protein B0H16DRAFT_1387033 [Mycena metata]|uniref:Novel STAND NTPase 1 domain-containing protein n=1 Tax=Mycena metata TaxID=1033252 RepID=A0AAD7HGJ3_9AGAR|nr:hypothetical protein B0H16DRAFT_1387033 [Mycena metata]